LDQQILQIQNFHKELEKKIKAIELSMKDLADVKIKQVSEDGNRSIANFKQEIDQQFRLANDNLIKSEDKTKEIL
jgi:BMFP domain-containing protein YqiC